VEASTADKLTGDALEARIKELDIEGTSSMTADQKRQAVAQKEQELASSGDGGGTPDPDTEDDWDDEEEDNVLPDDMAQSATPAQNAKLEHTQGGATTRDDAIDQGVPMLQGEATEPSGPEDALGRGPKRGDYGGRILPNLGTHQTVPSQEPGAGQPFVNEDGGVDIKPHTTVVSQVQNMVDRGEAPGEKGGVDTDPTLDEIAPPR
jgi:hypothetical protein